ncbi:lipase family protein [Nocardia sp. NPDC048505]|uniref:lipase family protein n=1 Tax=Nocardia sp. NPDC048505 TaxID=3155756 RepID=UPI0034047CB8
MAARQAVSSTGHDPAGRSPQIFSVHSLRRLALRALTVVAASTLSAGLLGAPPASAAIYPVPDPDPFYWAPPDLAGFQPGDIVRSRPIRADGFPGATGWQLLFRSSDSHDNPIAAVTTVLVPMGGAGSSDTGSAGGAPLLSYQPFVNSLGTQCAPSHSLFNGEMQEAVALNIPLARGWAVNIPDHLGPTSAYGAARLGGRITLDSIRAARRFEPAHLGNSRVGLTGYSGGGMATGFAAALAPEYAPELPIVGVAQGGVPVNIGKLALEAGQTPHPLFGLGFAAAIGLEREYPGEVGMGPQLNDAGNALRNQIANACSAEIIAAGANRSFYDVFKPGATQAGLSQVDPTLIRVLHENSLETMPSVPRAPVYQWHGDADQVNPNLVRELGGRYCAAGTPLLLEMVPGADHATAVIPGLPHAFMYMSDRFAGLPAPSNC